METIRQGEAREATMAQRAIGAPNGAEAQGAEAPPWSVQGIAMEASTHR